jgi:BirA family biotin operon repressor/biotin-[acetyl-CoA-carboxylase] ligase
MAERQTAGRGTHGRQWSTEPGNSISCSILIPLPARPDSRPWITAAAAVAVAQALLGTTVTPAHLKWPNDVLLGGRKVAGVLTEIPAGSNIAIVGIGLNVHGAPVDNLRYPATYVAVHAIRPVNRNELAVRLFQELDHLLIELNQRVNRVKEAWRLLVDPTGQRLRVHTAVGVVEGVARGVDASGALVFKASTGKIDRVAIGQSSVEWLDWPASALPASATREA